MLFRSYTFWHNNLGGLPLSPILQGYRSPLAPAVQQPPLWATVIGSDGYYPLAILSSCASDSSRILGQIHDREMVQAASCGAVEQNPQQPLGRVIIYPTRLWQVLWALVLVLCLFHTAVLLGAAYWSPATRDLAIRDNDQPRRRSTYVHVATAALFSMAVAVSAPAISLSHIARFSPTSGLLGVWALASAMLSVIVTFWKTRGYIGWIGASASDSRKSAGWLRGAYDRARANVYLPANLVVWTALTLLSLLWWRLCVNDSANYPTDAGLGLVGFSFSYRCLSPGSGSRRLCPCCFCC